MMSIMDDLAAEDAKQNPTICKNCAKAVTYKAQGGLPPENGVQKLILITKIAWKCSEDAEVMDYTSGETRNVNKSVLNQGACGDFKEAERSPESEDME